MLEGGCEGDVPRVSTVSLRGCVSRGVQANRKGVEKRQLNYLRTKLGMCVACVAYTVYTHIQTMCVCVHTIHTYCYVCLSVQVLCRMVDTEHMVSSSLVLEGYALTELRLYKKLKEDTDGELVWENIGEKGEGREGEGREGEEGELGWRT